MISQDNHVAPMQMPDPRAASIASPARTTPSTNSCSTVFSTSSDLKTVTPDYQHTDNSLQTNSTNPEDRHTNHCTKTIKIGRNRTSPQLPYTGGSVVCFLNDNVVSANLDMNSFRKLRMKRRLFLLTVMTIGFFTTMVYSLLFSCCTVITVDGSALPPRWEPGLAAILSEAPDQTSGSDISLPDSGRSSSTLRLINSRDGGSMAQTLKIGSPSGMLVVSGRASVIDREYYGKKIGSRTILLASSSDTFPLPESSMSEFPMSSRSIPLDITSKRSQLPINQQKGAAEHERGRTQHRQQQGLLIQKEQSELLLSTQQGRSQYHQQKVEKQKLQQMTESSNPRQGGQGSTFLNFLHQNRIDRKLPKSDSSSDEIQRDEGIRINHSTTGNKQYMVGNADYEVANGENHLNENDPIRLFSPGRNTRIDIQTEQRKETSDQQRHLSSTRETGDFKSDIPSSAEFNVYYVTGSRDIGTGNDKRTSRRADSKTNVVDSNALISDGSLDSEANDEDNVIYTDDQDDYYYTLGDSKTSGVPVLKPSTKERSVPIEDGIITEEIIFVDNKVKNNDSYFEYRDDEDGDGGDYYEDEDGVEGSDVSNDDVDISKHRHNTERSRTSLPPSLPLPVKHIDWDVNSKKDGESRHITERTKISLSHSLSLPPSFSSPFSRARSFSSEPNQLSASLRKGEHGSLSPAIPTSSSVSFRAKTRRAKRPSILQQHRHQSRHEIKSSLQNKSASLSFLSSSLSISSVLASAPVTADKLHVAAPPFAVPHHPRAGSSGVRVQHFPTKKLPQAIIIGVKKGGTRAVLEFLRLHPNVRAPGPEPHFFDRHYQKGFDWYRNKMPATFDDQITIEKTPSYFVTKEVPRRIFNMSKNVKLIVVVRDPVTRAISDYTQTVSKRTQVRSFEQMVFINNTRIVDTSWGAIRIGVYAKHVSVWLKFFNLSQIHFVNGERLITDPAGEMAQLQDFLGLKRIINERHFYFNETKGFPCLKKPEGSGHPHCLGKTKGRIHPIIPQKVLKRLRDFYRPFNSKFYQLVQKDFQWS